VDTVQSLKNREYDDIKIVIIDEAHYGSGTTMQSSVLDVYPDAIIIGLSATPIKPDGSRLEDWDDTLDVMQLADLIKIGKASPVRVLSPSTIDRSGFRTSKGDYNSKDVAEEVTKSFIVQNVVEKYVKYGENRRAIFYCINIDHAEILAVELREAGYRAMSYHSKSVNRGEIFEDFKSGALDILCSIEILTVGVDLPNVYCLVLASPTKSYVKSIQIYGRGSRRDNSLDRKLKKVGKTHVKKIAFIPRHDKDIDKIKEQLNEKGLWYIEVFSKGVQVPDGYEVYENIAPNNPNKICLILDLCGVIDDTSHPLQRLDYNKVKEERFKKCPVCEGKMILVKKDAEVIEIAGIDFVKSISTWQCVECGSLEIIEDEKTLEVSFCEKCKKEIMPEDKDIHTVIQEEKVCVMSRCPHCQHDKELRVVDIVDLELVENKLKVCPQDIFDIEDIKRELRKATNKDGKKYHHYWTKRVIDEIEEKGYSIEFVRGIIEEYVGKGWSLGGIMNVMSRRA